ncbi:MAG: hypothetical protein ACREB3_06945 [Burkholderiales bacterium]
MTVYVSYYELVLAGDRPREQLGSGEITSVLARRSAGAGVRVYLQEPAEPPRTRMRSGTVEIGPGGLRWPEHTDPHVLRGAWLRLLGLGTRALQALHAAWQREPVSKPSGWLRWDGYHLRAVDEAEALLALSTPGAGEQVYLELSVPPERTMEVLALLCAPGPPPTFIASEDGL